MATNRGVSLLYIILVISILLVISFGLSRVIIPQVKVLNNIGHSVVAFYAADSGIEKVLVNRQSPELTVGYYSGTLTNNASYEVIITPGGSEDCSDNFMFCIKAIGNYENTRRAIEINY